MTVLGRRIAVTVSVLFSEAVLLLLLRMPAVPGEGSWLQSFRGYFSYDQLSYAAIASTSAAGVGGLPEPFTETGRSFYPSLWYRILGWIASGTGSSVPAVWTVFGTLMLAAAVAVVGLLAYRVSGLVWSPVLVAVAITVGTLSIALHDNWYTTLDSHAVLWGPYGAMYVLNAEVIGFALGATALAIAVATVLRPPRQRRWSVVWLSVAAVLIGVIANIQTYSFLVTAGIAISWLGALGLVRSRSRILMLITLVLLVATFVLGPVVATRVSALAVYALFVACSIPGIVWLARDAWRLLLAPALLFVLAAAPQAALVLSGMLADDAFLSYRQDQSSDLGVPVWAGLLASLPVIAWWAFVAVTQRARPNDVIVAALGGMAFSGTMLSFNLAWGFGQEPYRLWIDSVAVSALFLVPLTAAGVAALRGTVRGRPLAIGSACVAVALLAVALVDFGSFRTYVAGSGVIRFDTARTTALADVTADADGLIALGPCLSPQEVKVATRKPIAFYNLGLAWPDNKEAIDTVLSNTQAGVLDADAMRAAGVRYVLVDSTCATQWPLDRTMGTLEVDARDYSDEMGAGTITLWELL